MTGDLRLEQHDGSDRNTDESRSRFSCDGRRIWVGFSGGTVSLSSLQDTTVTVTPFSLRIFHARQEAAEMRTGNGDAAATTTMTARTGAERRGKPLPSSSRE